MLFTIAVILLVLWLLGLVSGYTLGNFIYVLLVIALVLFVVGLVSGRLAVSERLRCGVQSSRCDRRRSHGSSIAVLRWGGTSNGQPALTPAVLPISLPLIDDFAGIS